MENGFFISNQFGEKYIRFAKPEYLQVYLYIQYTVHKEGVFPDAQRISRELDISPARAEFILDFWTSQGELTRTENGYELTVTPKKGSSLKQEKSPITRTSKAKGRNVIKPSYSMAEIDAVSTNDKHVSGLFYQAETILNKILTPSDMEMLFSFYDWLGLPVEVIMMLLSYAAKRGKTTKRYLETVAMDWADKGIDTFEAAEAYVSQLEAVDSAEHQIRGILGIYDRALTQTERKYIKTWCQELMSPPELVSVAYDKTVEHTGKLTWSYMNKLLQTWAAEGITTTEQVKQRDEAFYQAQSVGTNTSDKTRTTAPKSKFNNYEDTNKTDYDSLETQILDMILDEDAASSLSEQNAKPA